MFHLFEKSDGWIEKSFGGKKETEDFLVENGHASKGASKYVIAELKKLSNAVGNSLLQY